MNTIISAPAHELIEQLQGYLKPLPLPPGETVLKGPQ